MGDRKCVTCDLIAVAGIALNKTNERPALEQSLTLAYKLTQDLGLEGVKETMCAHHRLNYVMALAFGAKNIAEIPEPAPECTCGWGSVASYESGYDPNCPRHGREKTP